MGPGWLVGLLVFNKAYAREGPGVFCLKEFQYRIVKYVILFIYLFFSKKILTEITSRQRGRQREGSRLPTEQRA